MSLQQPDPTCTVNSTATVNGVDVGAGAMATIALVDPSGVKQWSITCVSTDETNAAAAVTASLTVNYTTMTASFTPPSDGSTFIFQSKVNNGNNPAGSPDPTTTTTFGVFVRTLTGYRVGAFNEFTEGDPIYGWASKVNAAIRSAQVTPQPPVYTTASGSQSPYGVPLPSGSAAVITFRVVARIIDAAHVLSADWQHVVHVQCSPSGVLSVLAEVVSSVAVQAPFVSNLSPYTATIAGAVSHFVSGNELTIQETGIGSPATWVQNTLYTVPAAGSAAVLCVNPNGLGSGLPAVYVLTGTGTSQNTSGAGPTGTGSSITDGGCTWAYVCAGTSVSIIWRLTSLSIEPV